MEIWYVRHGQTDWNVAGRIQGSTDISLNEVGIAQAKQTKQLLQNETFDLVFTSPLERAIHTAQIICEDKVVEMIVDDRLTERNFGEYEGTNVKYFPLSKYWNLDKNIELQYGESIQTVFHRIYDFLEECKIKYQDKKILVVAHGGISIPFRYYLEGIDHQQELRTLIIQNCEAIHYKI